MPTIHQLPTSIADLGTPLVTSRKWKPPIRNSRRRCWTPKKIGERRNHDIRLQRGRRTGSARCSSSQLCARRRPPAAASFTTMQRTGSAPRWEAAVRNTCGSGFPDSTSSAGDKGVEVVGEAEHFRDDLHVRPRRRRPGHASIPMASLPFTVPGK